MANALKYISNLGKSVTYSAIDKFKDMNPVVTEFAEQNSELGKILYESVKDIKGTAVKAYDYTMKSKVGEFGTEYMKAFFEDIKTGKLYNRERMEKMDIRASGDLLDFDDMMGDPFADMDLDSDSGTSFSFDDSDDWGDIDDNDKFLAEQIDMVGEKTANAVAIATGRSAEYVVHTNRRDTTELQRHNEYLVGKINVGMGAINSGIAGLIDFNQKVIKVHVENSRIFYDTSTKLDQERNSLLKQLLENQTNLYKSTVQADKKSDRIKYDDIVSANGAPNIKTYFKKIMQNATDMTNGTLDMMNIFEGGNLLLAWAGSPFKPLLDKFIKKMTPKIIEKSMGDLNNTLSGFFGSMISKLNNIRDDDDANGFTKMLAELFGISGGSGKRLNTSKYNRGAIPFDGETKMAITQVIPMHLAKIESALTGQTERMFDYKKGAFANLDQIKKEYEGLDKSYSQSASAELRAEMDDMLKTVRLGYDQDKLLREQISKMFEKSYKEGKIIDFNKKDLNAYELGIDDWQSFEIIKKLLKNANPATKLRYNAKVWEQRGAQERRMSQEELDPTSIYRVLENGFNIGQYANMDKESGKYLKPYDLKPYDLNPYEDKLTNKNPMLQNNLVVLRDDKGHNMYYYLQRLTEDVELMRYKMLSDDGVIKSSNSGNKVSIDSNGIITVSAKPNTNLHNREVTGIETAPSFKTNYDIQKEVEESEKREYDRQTQRMIENPKYKNKLWLDKDYSSLDTDKYAEAFGGYIAGSAQYKQSMEEIDENIKKQKDDSFFSRMKKKFYKANSISDNIKTFATGMEELSKRPITFIAGVLQRVDQRLYETIYGNDDGTDKLSPKSFMGALMAKLTSTFNSFNEFMKEYVFIPFKEMLFDQINPKDKLKELGKKIADYLGFDKAKEKSKTFVKDMIAGPKNYIKNAFGEIFYSDYAEKAKEYIKGTKTEDAEYYKKRVEELNKRQKEKAEELVEGYSNNLEKPISRKHFKFGRTKVATEYLNDLGIEIPEDPQERKALLKSTARQIEKVYPEIIDQYATGARTIKKTGLAALSEGEMVIPSELNPFYNKKTDKLSEIENENKVIEEFMKKTGKYIPGFATGNKSYEDPEKEEKKSTVNNVKQKVHKNPIKQRTKKIDGAEYEEDYVEQKDLYEEGKMPWLSKTAEVGASGLKKVTKALGLSGKEFKQKLSFKPKMEAIGDRLDELAGSDDSDELFKDAITDATKHFTDYLPGTAAGTLIGGGLSLITGAVGGPLLGAAVGAATSLTVQSDKVRDWLFGKMDENGERQGNVISKDLSQNINKYFPNMAKGATIGGITSILPFVPGGPVSGIVLGSAIGFATKSDKVQSFLFGDLDPTTGLRNNKGLFKPEFIKTLKESVPEMTLGGIGGALLHPFGLVGSIAVGASIGFLSKTKSFQEALFGKVNEETGEHEGGILGTIKTKFVDPLVNSIQPIGKQIQLGIKGLFKGASNLIHNFFKEELGIPFKRFFKEKIFDRTVNATKKVGKAIAKPAVSVLSAPFKMIGAVGDHLRSRQIASGNANYMTAQERVDYRDDRRKHGKDKFLGRFLKRGRIKNDDFKDFDQYLVDMTPDQLKSISKSLDYLKDPDKEAKELRQNSLHAINKAINNDFDINYKDSKSILSNLKNGKIDEAQSIIRRTGLDLDQQQRLNMLINTNFADYQTANTLLSDSKKSRDYIFAKLKDKGLTDIGDSTIEKYKGLVDQEISVKKHQSPEEWMNDKQEERHKDIVDLLEKLIDTIKITADPNSKEANALRTKLFNKNLKSSKKKKGAISLLDRGDSNLYGDYKFKYENGKLYRYTELDKDGNMVDKEEMDQATMLPLDENGDIKYDDFDIDDYGDFDPNASEVKAGNKVISGLRKTRDVLWNGKVSNLFKKIPAYKKHDAKIQAQLDELAKKDAETKGDEDESDPNITYREDMFGNPIKWVKNAKSGRWQKDDADIENKEYDQQTEPLKKNFLGRTFDKIGSLAKDIKSGVDKFFHIDKDDGTGKKVSKFALGGLGILTIAGAANVLHNWWEDDGMPKAKDFWQEHILPKIGKFIEPIKPTIARAAVGIDKVIGSIPTAINKLGNRIKNFLLVDFPKIWADKIIPFYEGGIDWLADKVGKVAETATYLAGKLLPSILVGAAKGIWKLLKTDIFTFFGGLGRRDSKSLLKSSSSRAASSFNTPSISKATKGSSFAQNIYKNVFGSSAYVDSGQAAKDNNVSEAELEEYYQMKTNTNPRKDQYQYDYQTQDISSSAYTSKPKYKNVSNDESYDYTDANSNDLSGYSEYIASLDEGTVDSQTANQYDSDIAAAKKEENKSKSLFKFRPSKKKKKTTTQSNIDDAINPYYDNGDGTVTDVTTGEVFNSSDIYNNESSDEEETEKKSIFDGLTKDSVISRFASAFARAGLTGRSGLAGAAAKFGSKLKIKHPKKVLSKAWNAVNSTLNFGFNSIDKAGKVNRELVKLGKDAAAEEILKNSADNVIDFSIKKAEKEAVKKGTKVAEQALEQTDDVVSVASKGITSKIDDFFRWISKNSIIKKYLKKSIDHPTEGKIGKIFKSLKGMSSKLDNLMQKAIKNVSGLAAKCTPFINIAFSVYDFFEGWRNAGYYLGLTEDKVTMPYKFICGIANLINNFITLGIVPLTTLIEVVAEHILPFIGIDMDQFNKMRNESAIKLMVYNAKHGTEYDLKKYNKLSRHKQLEPTDKPETAAERMNSLSKIENSAYYQTATDAYYAGISYNDYLKSMKQAENSLSSTDNDDSDSASGSNLIKTIPDSTQYLDKYDAYLSSNDNRYNYSASGFTISKHKDASAANTAPKEIHISNTNRYNNYSASGFKTSKHNNIHRYDNYVATGSGLQFSNYSARGSEGTNIVEETAYIIGKNETGSVYGKIVPDDGGSMSIGKYQYNANAGRAGELLSSICRAIPSEAKRILGDELYDLCRNGNLKGFVPNKDQADSIGNLLITDRGMEEQDKKIATDIVGYIRKGINNGITDPKALMYFADLYHQNPGDANATASYLKSHYSIRNLASIHKSYQNVKSFKYQQYKTRRDNTYVYCKDSLVTSNSTQGYRISNMSSGSPYVSVTKGTKSGNWLDDIFDAVRRLGNAWFGISNETDDSDIIADTAEELDHAYEGPEEREEREKAEKEARKEFNKQQEIENTKKILADQTKSAQEKAEALDRTKPKGFGVSPFGLEYSFTKSLEEEQAKYNKLMKEATWKANKNVFSPYKDAHGRVGINEILRLDLEMKNKIGYSKINDKGAYWYKGLISSAKRNIKNYDEIYKLWLKYGPYSVDSFQELMDLKFQAEAHPNNEAYRNKYIMAYYTFSEAHPSYDINSLMAYHYKGEYMDKKKAKFNKSKIDTSKRAPGMWEYMEEKNYVNNFNSANGSFISQLDPRYANNKIGDETVAKAGCGPATAAMAIDGLAAGNTDLMNATTEVAKRYKDNGGVKASYFADVFDKAGANTEYLKGSNKKSSIEKNLSKGNQVVLMGQDASNKSKANSPFGPGNHYVLAKGMSGNKVLVNDPELSGPRVYDKSILNNTKLGIAVSGKGSKNNPSAKGHSITSLYNAFNNKLRKLGDSFIGNEEIGDAAGDYYTDNSVIGDPTAANIINYARLFIGKITYSQALNERDTLTPNGGAADCSSFVRHVFGKFGINLGGNTAAQLHNGTEISSINDLRPGDLVMFKNTAKGKNNHGYERGVSHVGIYTGNDMFIHCSSGRNTVVEVPLSTSDLYRNHWLCGRRVINTSSSTAKGSRINNNIKENNIIDIVASGSRIPQAKGSAPSINQVIKGSAKAYEPLLTKSKNATPLNKTPVNTTAISNNTTNTTSDKLLNTMIKLLAQIATNTNGTKDLIALLSKILDKVDNEAKGSSIDTNSSSTTATAVKSKPATSAKAAANILSKYSESDKIDMNNLINDLNSILRD